MTVMLIIGGAQLLVLGIVGEYLGRLYLESKHRPIYLVDRIVGSRPLPEISSRQDRGRISVTVTPPPA
jgi:hypothetical protein